MTAINLGPMDHRATPQQYPRSIEQEAAGRTAPRGDWGRKTTLTPAVFDAGRVQSTNGEIRAGLGTTNCFTGFRRCAADTTPARQVVTAAILGDPRPGQFNHKPLWSYHKEKR